MFFFAAADFKDEMMDETLPGLEEPTHELIPLTVIRTETALSRFPIHRLVKHGDVQIEIRNQVSALLWEVTYNSKYGQPGPLAYKLDSLIVNRRIEEAGRPVPKLIRLGSLRDICREMGNSEGGESTHSIRRALLQNASAFINAKLSYRATDRTERWAEIADTRYGVIFTGEKLPSTEEGREGQEADAVYLVLHDNYRAILEAALTRPLNYDYMKSLPPSAQRFYEIVSYQIYAALLHRNERAKLRYSEFCLLSTQTRYFDFDHAKKQMYKVHRPHLASGYLAKVTYEQTTTSEGQIDWFMFYTPGINAANEFQSFAGRPQPKGKGSGGKIPSGQIIMPLLMDEETPPRNVTDRDAKVQTGGAAEADFHTLVERLIASDVNRTDAERLARANPDECKRQLEYLLFKSDVENPGGYLRTAIESGFPPPKEYKTAKAKEERARKTRDDAAQRMAEKAAQEARTAAEVARLDNSQAALEKTDPAAFSAFAAYVQREREQVESRYAKMTPSIRKRMLDALDTSEKRRELFRAWQQLPDAERIAAPVSPPAVAAAPEEDDSETVRALFDASFGKTGQG